MMHARATTSRNDADEIMRYALWAAAIFNVGGALLFAFPGSLGRMAGLPAELPRVYGALLVSFVLLFGGAYAWLALQPVFDRPLVALAAIGKAGAFAVVFACWLLGDVSVLSVVAISGDLAFALLFAWWLSR